MVYDIQDYWVSETLCSSSTFLEYQTMDKVQKPNSPEFIMMFSKTEFCQTGILHYLKKDFHGHQPHQTYNLMIIFCGDTLRRE
jgi:hypothetical protein